jgi:CGNR zinc finger
MPVYNATPMIDIEADDTTPAAPGNLEVLQRFLNLHDHAEGTEADQPPLSATVRAYLVRAGLLDPAATFTSEDHDNALALFGALHGRLRAQDVGEPTTEHDRALEAVARRAIFRLSFDGEPELVPAADGADAALARLLALLFVAEMDGTWWHMKECASETCTAVFYDRSKNHSGKWCSMQSCGNKHKVRAWRRRHRADAVDA